MCSELYHELISMPCFSEIALSDERDDGIAPALDIGETFASTIPTVAPRAASLFEPVRDRYGWRLALVFGNHAPNGRCPYYPRACFHCDIGAGEGSAFDHATNRRRLNWFRDHYRAELDSISHLVLYNSGSILNPREMPPEMLDEILGFARSLAAVRIVSVDSREAYIKPEALVRMISVLGRQIMLRPILGIETADDRLRNDVLQKAMPRVAIERVYSDLSALGRELGPGRIGLDVNIVIAGPGTSPGTAVEDAVATARYALDLSAHQRISVDLNLHPYYRGDRGASRFPDYPRCSLGTTVRAVSAIAALVRSMAVDTSIFVGWQDEGHDRERQERDRDLERGRAAFDRFNQTNDPDELNDLG
jgi:hypothetical protein